VEIQTGVIHQIQNFWFANTYALLKRLSTIKVWGRLFWETITGKKNAFPPKPGKVKTGNFGLRPFSSQFGYDRGGPIDRFYIEKFLDDSAGDINGRVLEIGDNTYTLRFGKQNVQQSDVLHIDPTSTEATIIGDISDAPHIPSDSFDCIILTQTLHLIYEFRMAVQTCHRILKPGGVLLLTVPGISPIAHDQWRETWYWSFTALAMEKVMNENFNPGYSEIHSFGNAFVATGFLYGMGIQEVTTAQLMYNDPYYPVIITVKSVKS
jgi:SAM-dependent methyltransferase